MKTGKITLMQKFLLQFALCAGVLLAAATPLFYLLTKNYYAEDMIDIIEAVQQGKPMPAPDLEEDILHGVVLQFVLILSVLGAAIVLMLGLLSKRLWRPFDRTLEVMESFRLEDGVIPQLPESGISEFSRLNSVLGKLMDESINSYRIQKEFTENASHELQTPLAVFQSKLDMLLQQPELTEEQAAIIQDLYRMNGRLSRLNRNLLLLAKMDNGQFAMEEVELAAVLRELRPFFENLCGDISLNMSAPANPCVVEANRPLLECLLNNLVVNAVRHNIHGGDITVSLSEDKLTVSNTSDEPALDASHIFSRFYRPGGESSMSAKQSSGTSVTPTVKEEGNGLGLSIVKAVCDYHGWDISYSYSGFRHRFEVTFSSKSIRM